MKNPTALFSDKKSFTLQKRSKKTFLYQRANHEDQKLRTKLVTAVFPQVLRHMKDKPLAEGLQ